MQVPIAPPYLLVQLEDYLHPSDLAHRAAGQTAALAGAHFTLLADRPGSPAGLGLVLATLPGSFGGIGRHLHRQTTELCYVLRGTLAFTSGAETGIARAGSLLLLPAGTSHALWNPTPAPVSYLAVYSPAGAEQWVAARAAGEPASAPAYDHFDVDAA